MQKVVSRPSDAPLLILLALWERTREWKSAQSSAFVHHRGLTFFHTSRVVDLIPLALYTLPVKARAGMSMRWSVGMM